MRTAGRALAAGRGVPVGAAAVAFVLGSMPVTEHVTRCAPAVPCPSVHAVVVLPERVLSGLLLAVLTFGVASTLSAMWRASLRPASASAATPRAVSALALAVLAVPVSMAVGLLASFVWALPRRTTGWSDLPVGLLTGATVAVVLLGCAVAALLATLRATAAEPV